MACAHIKLAIHKSSMHFQRVLYLLDSSSCFTVSFIFMIMFDLSYIRVVSSDVATAEGVVNLMRQFDWTRVAVITQQETIFTSVRENILSSAVILNEIYFEKTWEILQIV